MMDWLQYVFSEKSDMAKFISILVSFLIAIVILGLTQWHINRRERKKIKIEKIEQIYLSSIDYVNSANALISNLKLKRENNEYVMDSVALRAMNDSLNKIEMLCGLYFKNSNFVKSNYGLKYLPAVAKAFMKDIPPGYAASDNLYSISLEHVKYAEDSLSKICIKLMKDSRL
jgi:hypothetical protein